MPSDLTADADALQLLTASRTGDAAALGRLMEKFRRYLMTIAEAELVGRVRPKVMPSDVVQDAYLEAFRAFDRFNGAEADEFRAWLRAILLNKVREVHAFYLGTAKRNPGREHGLPNPNEFGNELRDGGPSPSTEASQSEQAAVLAAALNQLDETGRQVIIWRSWDRLPFAEIGARLGRSEDAARMVFTRALEWLQEVMDRGRRPD